MNMKISALFILIAAISLSFAQVGCTKKKSEATDQNSETPPSQGPGGDGTQSPAPPPAEPPGPIYNAAGSIIINGGAIATNQTTVTLELLKEDSVQMMISDNDRCDKGTWEPYSTTKIWTLPLSQSTNTLSIKYKDAKNVESVCANSSIIHDSIPPLMQLTSSAQNNGFSNNPYTFDLYYADTGTGSGTKDLTCLLDGSAIPCPFSKSGSNSIVLNGLAAGSHTFLAQVTDQAGNTSSANYNWTLKDQFKSLQQTLGLKSNNKVDILIVVDNTANMKTKQRLMVTAIAQFIDQIKNLDWQISVTTTDPVNTVYGDGRLLGMSPIGGLTVLKSGTAQNLVLSSLSQTIMRREVGSSSKFGINSIYRAIERNLDPTDTKNFGFVRADAALITLVLTDGDDIGTTVKSSGKQLLDFINKTWNGQKNFVFDGILTKTGDQQCLTDQKGVAGKSYETLAKDTGMTDLGGAMLGSVCDADYPKMMTGIGASIAQINQTVNLNCEPVGKVDISYNGTPFSDTYTVNYTRLSFKNVMPTGDYVIKYSCLNN